VDLFDSLSTMIACGKDSGILAGDPAMTRLERALKVDASATVVGSLLGVPTVTTYVECATGISAGARTGLASLVTAACFALTLLLSPVIQAVPAFATAPALVMAGVFMFKNVRHLEFSRMDELIPAVLTLILMPLTFNISVGIAAGFISWTALKILTGRIREIRASMWVCTVLALSALAEMMLPAGLPILPH